MTPVIRISDSTYRRLQALSVPLDDTPDAVIQRVLDRYDAVNANASSPKRSHDQVAKLPSSQRKDTAMLTSIQPANVYLAPAHPDNVADTISKPVSHEVLHRHLTDPVSQRLLRELDEIDPLFCWGTTTGKEPEFESMRAGDLVLICPRASGLFTHSGVIVAKTRSRTLGDHLWSVRNGKPWELIYFLRNVKQLRVPKTALMREFGYDKDGDNLMGLRRVDHDFLRSAIRRHGDIETLISSLDQ